MKLIYAIVRNDNEDDVVSQLTQHRYSVTRLSTTGGFLKKGNTTLMIGAEDDKVEEVISIIKQECGQHQKLTVNMPYISGTTMVNYATMPMTVDVGGATIFVINVDRYEKSDRPRGVSAVKAPGREKLIFGDFLCSAVQVFKKMQKFMKIDLFPVTGAYIIRLYALT